MKLRWTIGLGLLHLVAVIVGATEANLSSDAFKLLRYYGSLSGSAANYSFFAPSVGSPLRASFYLTDDKGATIVEEADASDDREIALRLGNVVDAFRDKLQDEKVRRSIAASWSGLVLSKYPSARKVRFVLDEFHIPTMEAFRGGEKMAWVEDYSASFERRSER